MTSEHFDVLVAGAGISGICAGYHLQTSCPGRTYAILEARDDIGGTWHLFRYPGIRSDSDMYTLGYSFKPWNNSKAIADGWSILEYLRETAREYDIDRKIRFGHRVKRASWSSDEARWTVEVERGEGEEAVTFTCDFLFMCSGYFDYAITRWKNVLLGLWCYRFCRLNPKAARAMITRWLRNELGPSYDATHFNPRYNPWEQRLCLVPDRGAAPTDCSGG